MAEEFETEDYVLRWPVETFRSGLAELVNGRLSGGVKADWPDRVEHLLADAFESEQPARDFLAIEGSGGDPWAQPAVPSSSADSARQEFLVRMLRAADSFPYEVERRPYRSQRRGRTVGSRAIGLGLPAAAAVFVTLVSSLEGRGYFERSFKKDCVDDPSDVNISAMFEMELGVADLWPLSSQTLGADEDLFLDVVEAVGDFVALPQERRMHSYGGCGWHHSDFNLARGRDIYYWQANRLLARTSFGLQLATSGEDRGRLVEVAGDARNDLVAKTIEGAAPKDRTPIQHAVALFRRRGATDEDKRSACLALARVLEGRRALLKETLLRRDEGALFQIANEFDLRHRAENQKPDYDPVFLDWVFWWYLGTVELTDRIVRRQECAAAGQGAQSERPW